MIERQTIDGRQATVAYFDANFNPVDPRTTPDHFAKILFDDGEMCILRSPNSGPRVTSGDKQ